MLLTIATVLLVALGGSASALGPSDGSAAGVDLPEPGGVSQEEWEAKNGPGECCTRGRSRRPVACKRCAVRSSVRSLLHRRGARAPAHPSGYGGRPISITVGSPARLPAKHTLYDRRPGYKHGSIRPLPYPRNPWRCPPVSPFTDVMVPEGEWSPSKQDLHDRGEPALYLRWPRATTATP